MKSFVLVFVAEAAGGVFVVFCMFPVSVLSCLRGIEFQVNAEFSTRFIRVKVPLVTLASLEGSSAIQMEPQAGADVPASVEQDRNHL